MLQGSRSSSAFVLVDGEVAVLGPDQEPGGTQVATIERGELFGEVALLTNMERTATIVANSDTEVMALDRATFEHQMVANPQAALALLRTLGMRFHEVKTQQLQPR